MAIVQMIIELQKKGVHIHLTDEGYKEFIRAMNETKKELV